MMSAIITARPSSALCNFPAIKFDHYFLATVNEQNVSKNNNANLLPRYNFLIIKSFLG